jgi:LuxR family maltose regulon positive regulatory protein
MAPMTTPLLTTKLHIPPVRHRERVVLRPHLIEQLNAGPRMGRKLTLISAPAGFGKTTLVSEWIHCKGAVTAPLQVAWLSLDEGDNEPARFLAYVIAALRTIQVDIAKEALSGLQSPQPPPTEAILSTLINEIAAIPDRIVLVLDDYHLIEAQSIHKALTFLLRRLPLQMHLVVATREDPLFPLARLRARGQLTELRAADLRFSFSEAAEFLNQVMGLDLSAEDVAALEDRTEGWIAGLQLAAISMQGYKDASSFIQSFTGSHRFVLDYLVEEVLEQQSESVQAFLLQTAILDRLTGSLCDAVRFGDSETPIGQDDGQTTLEMLERANLFIVPLDEERRWYRYHHLFSDLLRQRLHQTQLEQVRTLHQRASEWYEQNGFADEAIEHALRAEDFERAAQQIERVAEAVWVPGEDAKLHRWLDRLPVELVFSRPQLGIYHAWYLLASGRQDAAERTLQAAELALGTSPGCATEPAPQAWEQPYGLNKLMLRGRLATTQAFAAFYRGDAPAIIQCARKALEYLPEQDSSWRNTAIHVLGDAYDLSGAMEEAYHSRLEALNASSATGGSFVIMIVNLKLAIILRHQGRLQRVKEICRQQMQIANASGIAQTVVVGWLLAIWGEVLAETNDLDRAIRLTKKGVEIAEGGGDLAMLGWSYLCLTRILFSLGHLANAEEIVHKVENRARESYVPPWIMNLNAAWQARIWLAQGKLEAATQWIADCGLDAHRDPTYLHEMEYIVLARILIAQEQLDKATTLLQRLLHATETGGRTSRAIEILNLQALAFQATGDTDRAMIMLERALTLAEPGGFIRIFVDEGPPLARLLEQLHRRGVAGNYITEILAAFETTDNGPQTTQTAIAPSDIVGRPSLALVEPLSERELEVLQLIAAGLTNAEIAARLYLALNTVKAHTRNIYGKLDVHSRIQAVARSQELELLPRTRKRV